MGEPESRESRERESLDRRVAKNRSGHKDSPVPSHDARSIHRDRESETRSRSGSTLESLPIRLPRLIPRFIDNGSWVNEFVLILLFLLSLALLS